MNLQIPISPHALSDFFFLFTIIYHEQKLFMRGFSSEGSILRFPFPNVSHGS